MSTNVNDSLPGNMVSNFDQATAAHANIAGMVAAYYQSLVQNGVPDEVAATLAKDMNAIWWTRLVNQLPASGS